MSKVQNCDLLIVGGGLAGGLIAYTVVKQRPGTRVVIVEKGETLGGNHIWSFFDTDMGPEDRAILAPMVSHYWEGHNVVFPGIRRKLEGRYYSITSERFDATVRQVLPPEQIITGRRAVGVGPRAVVLSDGMRITAQSVIDTRGAGDLSLLDVRWQKFLGQEIWLEEPHHIQRPVVMDATVEQVDGYRFVYLLPLGPNRLFVEDTYYSDSPEIDREELSRRIASYVRMRGWKVTGMGREERGALPIVLGGDFAAYWRSGGAGVPKAGVRAGLFHPTTGYSIADSTATARFIAARKDLSATKLHNDLRARAQAIWRERGFYRMLDRMMFNAAEPAERYRVLQHFYRLDPTLIGHFYAARSTAMEKMRILSGRPPVPVGRAIRAIGGDKRVTVGA